MGAQAVARAPSNKKALARLEGAYQLLVARPPEQGILQRYHNSFYQTDYRSESYKKTAQGEKPSTVAASTTESKPAEKKESKPAEKKANYFDQFH
mgnify:CR=1 FL=1